MMVMMMMMIGGGGGGGGGSGDYDDDDYREFEICVLSPYCGLVENASKSFQLSDRALTDLERASKSFQLSDRALTVPERLKVVPALRPARTVLERASKSFQLCEQTSYVELQLRRVFRVPVHRRTRLWICEKSRHARFLPLLDRSHQLCLQVNRLSPRARRDDMPPADGQVRSQHVTNLQAASVPIA